MCLCQILASEALGTSWWQRLDGVHECQSRVKENYLHETGFGDLSRFFPQFDEFFS